MDPIANLEFAHAFRASDDLGDITMDQIAMHHFSLTVDPGKYVAQLKADPNSGGTPQDGPVPTNSAIPADDWSSARASLKPHMRIDITTPQSTRPPSYHFSHSLTPHHAT